MIVGIYKGCFFDSEEIRDLNGSFNLIGFLSNDLCIQLCSEKNYTYSGTQIGYKFNFSKLAIKMQ